MNAIRTVAAMLGAALVGGVGSSAYAQQKFDFGKREYDSNCAACHGLQGKGDGVYKPFLTKSPTDLTVLSKNNAGVFPMDRVYSVIDGRTDIRAHGPGDMPVWGRDYSAKYAEGYTDMPYHPEMYVRTRILALTEYIARLQAK